MHVNNKNTLAYKEFAVWPTRWEGVSPWIMYSLILNHNYELKWKCRYVLEGERYRGQAFSNYNDAVLFAQEINESLSWEQYRSEYNPEFFNSLILKVEKEKLRKSRLLNEEQSMLDISIKRNRGIKIRYDDVKIESEIFQPHKDLFIEHLINYPYVEILSIPKFHNHLFILENGVWVEGNLYGKKAAKVSYQETIARGFGLSGLSHWGKTKAAIREMMLPRVNKLLGLASVKRMLADAEKRGQNVLLVDGYVFWRENSTLKWEVKIASYSKSDSKGNTLWIDGTISSKNHRRIVVLPYIKSDGTKVKGHTKNSSNEGKALPRHKSDYLDFPFEISKGDAMRGLLGELYYD